MLILVAMDRYIKMYLEGGWVNPILKLHKRKEFQIKLFTENAFR